jgi:predicted MPP superfamily phosphohydrolase
MKLSSFVIFFSVFITLYSLINYYIFRRGLQAIPVGSGIRIYYIIFFIFVAASFILGRVIERYHISLLSDIIVWIGSFWLAAILYFFLIIVLLDLSRVLNHFFSIYPTFLTLDYEKTKYITLICSISLVSIILLAGHINAYIPRINEIEFDIDKQTTSRKELTAVLLTDIHLGTMFSRSRLEKVIAQINSLNPDIVILGGDIVDEDLKPVIRQDLGSPFREIKAPLGIIAITGNHEYIGGAEQAVEYLEKYGIHFLRDSVICLDNEIYFVGREDRSKNSFSGKKRKTLSELMTGVDLAKPIILLDHQPIGLNEGNEAGADVQLSGHTHDGQLMPISLITRAIYDDDMGYLLKGKEHIYVSQGLGTWGPPMRLGNRPEIVKIKFKFK